MQVVENVSEALGENSDTVEMVFKGLFRAYAVVEPYDWATVEQLLYAQPPLQYDKLATLMDVLKGMAIDAGGGGDPHTVFDDCDLRSYFGPGTQAPTADTGMGAGQPDGAPVEQGSLIHRVGDAYYLGQDHQVWQAQSEDSVYYHDGTQNFDTLGRPLDAPGAAPAAGQSEDPESWNQYLAQNGPRWDGSDASWQQFRDWFVYDAAAHGVGTSAQGFIALAERGDKQQVFADYGVALPTTATDATGTDDLLDRLHQEVMQPALAQILLADPELAALGEDRLHELLAEITADHLARRTP